MLAISVQPLNTIKAGFRILSDLAQVTEKLGGESDKTVS